MRDAEILETGVEKRPLIVIDGFLPDADALRTEAECANFRPFVRFFPGVQAPFSFDRMREFIAPHEGLIGDAFHLAAFPRLIECGFALVTTKPSDLAPLQRIPHIDTTDPQRLAILAYISGCQFGGTAFYRHKSTGFESIDDAKVETYNRSLDLDIERHGVPAPSYIAGDTPLFDLIAKIDAKPGRAIIYNSNSLHSGHIENAHRLQSSPATGRLTLNAFLSGNA